MNKKIKTVNATLEDIFLEASVLYPECRYAYEGYKEAVKKRKGHNIRGCIGMGICLILLVVSFFYPPFLISSVLFLLLANTEILDARIELLWKVRYSDQIVDFLDAKKLRKCIENVEFRNELIEKMPKEKR